MIPSVLATQYREGLIDYVETTFPVTSPIFEGSIRRFLEKENAFFHEPYISVRLPFRVAVHGNERFEAIHSAFPPYVHQNKAYDRLCGDDCQSTLVATGTGSGKTECFMNPVLEYCWQHRGEKGIKALIIYPMNALASDQALRIAKQVDASPELRGNVTVGMYVGGISKHDSKTMQPDKIITDHETLLNNPPDILLTNYKMLDYLLVRPKDAGLWKHNNPLTLKYIVVDELHTFDGAQGTDLACLIRRLKSRLYVQPGYLCCVGTSATMGGKDSLPALCEYASKIFGEPFLEEAVITEDRVSALEFLSYSEVSHFHLLDQNNAEELRRLAEEEDEQEYLTYAAECWFGENAFESDVLTDNGRVELAEELMHHSFFHSLMETIGSNVMQSAEICGRMSLTYPIMQEAYGATLLDAMLALISHARIRDKNGHLRPFLQVQLQVWMRELRRVMGSVSPDHSDFVLEADLSDTPSGNREHYQPVVNCRECGATGWAGLLNEVDQLSTGDLKVFYNKFFDHHKSVRMVFPRRAQEDNARMHDKLCFCPQCLYVQVEKKGTTKCAACGCEKTIPVWVPVLETERDAYVCPFCGGKGSLILVGLRSTTAISAGISQLYASRFNDDKKLLAFNDNVQDAAHKASFFNARTWRFGLRTAIQHFVDESANGMALSDFSRNLSVYWRSRMSDEAWVDTFIPHNMAANRAYEALQKTGGFPDEAAKQSLMSALQQRISQEVILEYGSGSRIGRTLEKSGASMLMPSPTMVNEVVEAAMPRIRNEAGIRELTNQQVQGYLNAWITHMRQAGAIADPSYMGYVAGGGSSFMLSTKMKWWMPDTHRDPLFPCAVRGDAPKYHFELLNENSWYVRKLSQLLGKLLMECPGILDTVSILLDEMEKHGVIERMEGPKGLPVFGLSPIALVISNQIGKVRCRECGQMLSVPLQQMGIWEKAPCLRENCIGHYLPASDVQYRDYYASLYAHGELVRVHAREHTGLLQRDDREQLEVEFKHKTEEHKVWEPNLLSCTPTLEMGIDIGDLSTVVLCSVPPSQAQYLQRIGRAGRTDGNALTVAVAGARPHDMYYYQDPMEMISGQVDPPGVFLNASAVLERQFVAFCFDCWVRSGIQEQAIPTNVKTVLGVIKKDPAPQDAFPFSFLKYVRSHLTQLNNTFVQMFPGELTPDSIARIQAFSKGTNGNASIDGRIISTFCNLWEERESLRKDIEKLRKAIDALKAKPKDSSFDEQMRDLENERKGLSSVINAINDKNIFNFLSDEGLLPNYAFPEAGVSLKAVLTRKKEHINAHDESDSDTESITYEYSRSSSSAISEFAPDNSFYAGGHQLKIDQIDVRTSEPVEWRLCPNCNHAEPASSLHNLVACPACGSNAWGDQGQVRQMLKVRTVYSNTQYESSRIGDESDDRASKFFSKQMLVDVDEANDIECGYQTTDGKLPFGYEFVRKATMREINFGESDNIGTKLKVAGREDVRNGFRLCRFCGKVQPRSQKAKPIHTSICKAAAKTFKDTYEECMFLYREFTSEAIRILIPATSMDTNTTKMESFSAAIMLGMRQHFGSVEHLKFTVMDAPVQDAEYRKQYLVIYDSVPGGTGYLKELTNTPDSLMDVFDLSLKAMEACNCEDGCYHCLFAYRQSNKLNSISKHSAQDMLRKILSGRDSLEKIPSISQIAVNTLFDSELEKRFVEAFANASAGDRTIDIHKQLVSGKEGYLLKIKDAVWEIELQAPFTTDKGFVIASKPDFVLRPKHVGHTQRAVAVFTDGFMYHKDKIADDTRKRMAIRATDEYRVWSLSWKDVDDALAGKKHVSDMLNLAKMPSGTASVKMARAKGISLMDLANMSSFDLLLRYLSDEDDSELLFRNQAELAALAMLETRKIASMSDWSIWQPKYNALVGWPVPNAEFGKVGFGARSPSAWLQLYSCIPLTAIQSSNLTDTRITIRFDDREANKNTAAFEASWQEFLLSSNLFQFIQQSLIVSENGLLDGMYDAVVNELTTDSENDTGEGSAVNGILAEWNDIIENQIFDPIVQSLAKKLAEENSPLPTDIGYELEDDSGACIGEAELAWSDLKIVVLTKDQEENRTTFESNGWTAYACDDLNVLAAVRGEING